MDISTEFMSHELQLNALVENFGGVDPSFTTDGVQTSKIIRDRMRVMRLSVEEKRKELKAPLLADGKKIDLAARKITDKIKGIETPHQNAIDQYNGKEKHTKVLRESVKLTEEDLEKIIGALWYSAKNSDDFSLADVEGLVDRLAMSLNKVRAT